MKKLLLLITFISSVQLYAQLKDSNTVLYNSEWKSTKSWFGGDTVVMEPTHLPDTAGLDLKTQINLLENYWRYERISFDSLAEIKKYNYYMWCPTGEDIRQVVEFKLIKRKIALTIRITHWGETKYHDKRYWYEIGEWGIDKIVLYLAKKSH